MDSHYRAINQYFENLNKVKNSYMELLNKASYELYNKAFNELNMDERDIVVNHVYEQMHDKPENPYSVLPDKAFHNSDSMDWLKQCVDKAIEEDFVTI